MGMWAKLDSSTYKRFHNVIFPTPRGTTQVDHIVLSAFGIFVIETKSHNGWIFGSEKSSRWTQSLYGKKIQVPEPSSPKLQPYQGNSRFFADIPCQCPFDHFFHWRQRRVEDRVPAQCDDARAMCLHQKLQGRVFSESEVGELVNKVKLLQDRQITNSEHVANLKTQYSDHTCPKCGKALVKRKNS